LERHSALPLPRISSQFERPNKPLELTPQAASKIAAILKADFGSTAFPVYTAAQLSGRPFGGPFSAYANFSYNGCRTKGGVISLWSAMHRKGPAA